MTAQLPIKLLLLAAGGALVVYLARARGTARASAAVKLLFIAFLVFGVWAVLRPDDVSALARLFGVGAGMNLLLYALVVAFAFTTVSNYLKFQELEARYVALARVIALQGAVKPDIRGSALDSSETTSKIVRSPASGAADERENTTA